MSHKVVIDRGCCFCGCGSAQPCQWDPRNVEWWAAQDAIAEAKQRAIAERVQAAKDAERREQASSYRQRAQMQRHQSWLSAQQRLAAQQRRLETSRRARQQDREHQALLKSLGIVWGGKGYWDPPSEAPIYGLWIPRVTVTLDDYDRHMT